MKVGLMKSRKNVTYVKGGFFMIKITKRNLNYTKKLEIIVIIQENLEELLITCNLNYKVPKEIPVKTHNGSKHDYHFISKELAEEFKAEFECLGENTVNYISFSVPIKKRK